MVAVSPSYADEMLTKEFGAGLDEFLATRKDTLTGIINGIDTESFDPAIDQQIATNFTAETLDQRIWNKTALQKKVGLTVNKSIPVLSLISRMDVQKGIDLAIDTLNKMKGDNWQAVILGTGDPVLEKRAKRLEIKFPGQVKVEIRYDGRLARKIYAGSDMFLMPSRYEPCGLSQMISMRYGCMPIVRATGGLKDTVKHGETGFVFDGDKPRHFLKAIKEAMDVYENPKHWQSLQRNAMAQDFSWKNSALKYTALYRSLLLHEGF
jgi:starch synthase